MCLLKRSQLLGIPLSMNLNSKARSCWPWRRQIKGSIAVSQPAFAYFCLLSLCCFVFSGCFPVLRGEKRPQPGSEKRFAL